MPEKRLTSIARKLPNELIDAEKRLWSHLRARQLCGVKFTRQFPIGNFIADFASTSLRIAIELDGGQHADSAPDAGRTEIIGAHGYRVIRFWNNEVLQNTDAVLQGIPNEIAVARNR